MNGCIATEYVLECERPGRWHAQAVLTTSTSGRRSTVAEANSSTKSAQSQNPLSRREKKKEIDRRYRRTQVRKEISRRYGQSLAGKATRKRAKSRYEGSSQGRVRTRQYQRKQRQKNRECVFNHYGNVCARCGFSDYRALSIDHINGGGTKHRKETGDGSSFYEWLVARNYPDGFQTLCMNCQFIKRYENNEMNRRIQIATVAKEQLPLFDGLNES